MSVVIHEVSHGYAALALGDSTAKYQGRLTLNPLSHLDPMGSFLVPLMGYFLGGFIIGWAKPVPFNPYNLKNQRWGEALVAFAGPLSNIVLALIFGLIIRMVPESFVGSAFLSLAGYVVILNITLAVFNLIPMPPLDGSKILFAFLPYKLHWIKESIEGAGIVFVLILVFFLWRFIVPLVYYIFALITGIGI